MRIRNPLNSINDFKTYLTITSCYKLTKQLLQLTIVFALILVCMSLCQLYQRVIFCNKSRKKTEEEPANKGSPIKWSSKQSRNIGNSVHRKAGFLYYYCNNSKGCITAWS